MRVLFVSWAWPSHLLPLVPLAWAFRAAGHEVVVATQPPLLGTVTGAGLPAAPVGSALDHAHLLGNALRPLHPSGGAEAPAGTPAAQRPGRRRRLGLSVRLAEDMTDDVVRLCTSWRPELVLHEPTTYAGPLAAAALGIPHAPVLWGVNFHAAAQAFEREAFADLCAQLGIEDFDSRGMAAVDPCPPSLQVPSQHPRLGLRHVPYNGSCVVPDWLNDRPHSPRICLSWGVTPQWAGTDDHAQAGARQRELITTLAGLDAEIVVAVASRELLGGEPLPDNVRVVERLPLHLVLPSCQLLVSRGGAGSMMAAVAAGVPQLCLPQYPSDLMPAERLAGTGAAVSFGDTPPAPAAVRDTVELMLRTPSFRAAATRLRAEAERQPAAAAVVSQLADMARDFGRRPTDR
ncbi:nucleotide disphospho-sugar-binding domain-containing protein [Streptomyces morookaense]|uniref:nucleotide disphospho-sugar-binding domain-containing protein n=1 Tax=Streptomyces morookaense TaxID=1970 RepID=UPI00341023B4